MKENRFPFWISPTQAQEIIDIACDSWKQHLSSKWGSRIVQRLTIEIDEYFYKKMRSCCTRTQHRLFDLIFGKDVEEFKYRKGKRFKHKNGGVFLLCFNSISKKYYASLNYIEDGNRWADLVEVDSFDSITISDFDKIADYQASDFTLID